MIWVWIQHGRIDFQHSLHTQEKKVDFKNWPFSSERKKEKNRKGREKVTWIWKMCSSSHLIFNWSNVLRRPLGLLPSNFHFIGTCSQIFAIHPASTFQNGTKKSNRIANARFFFLSLSVCLSLSLSTFLCRVGAGDEVSLTPESSPELTKRSWFGTLMGSERDETYTILVKGKPLASVKADLIHAFLSVSLNITSSPYIPFFSVRLSVCLLVCLPSLLFSVYICW